MPASPHRMSPRPRSRADSSVRPVKPVGQGSMPGEAVFLIGARGTITRAMALLNVKDLLAAMPPQGRVIGIDPGAKTIGLALSDVRRRLASPYGSLKRGKLKANAAEVAAIARKEGAYGLIVGLPLSMDGTAGPAAQAARDWTHALSDALGRVKALWGARLSSAAVNPFAVCDA